MMESLWGTSQSVVPEEVLCLRNLCMVPCIYVYLDFDVFCYFQYGFELMSILFILCFGYAHWMDFYVFANGNVIIP